MIKRSGRTTDEVSTPFGIRTLSWPVKRFTPEGPVAGSHDGRFFLNGIPTFLNGVCEYEHQFGQSHAFSKEQVLARVKGLKAAGFNAFRDAHQPHHLDYQMYFDREGMVWWTQFSAHVWYDTPEFRENFKKLLRQWVKERRNSPSLSLWGLQNESTLLREFAEECCDIIREMDPTAVTMRPITTCNGGDGSDWNVIQNWSGTYGGDIYKYGYELSRPNQLLNGEYGAWRSIDLHTEPAAFDAKGIWSEERMCLLMETKIRQAESVKDSVCGQFQWIYSSHDNPGRRQPDEALRRIDKVGPFNYKGLVTPWEEPLDVYYMYKSEWTNEPVLHIFPHWNWEEGEPVDIWAYYNNADEVELYLNGKSLGVRQKTDSTYHVSWRVPFTPGTLRAVSRLGGKEVLVKEIHTAGEPARLVLTPDRSVIQADGSDLSFVTVDVCDIDGNRVPDATPLIRFSVEGPGEIAGTDNGDPNDPNSLRKPKRQAYYGKALVVIRNKGGQGDIHLKAIAEGLPEATVTLQAQ